MSAGVGQRVLLIGGTSEIGLAILRRLATDAPIRPYLLGRDRARLEHALSTLAERVDSGGAVGEVDASDLDDPRAMRSTRAFEQAGGFELVVLAVGVLGAQSAPRRRPG